MNFIALMRGFTIRTRMLGAVAIITLTLLALGGVGVAAQVVARAQSESFIKHDFEAMTQIAQLRTAMATMRSHEKDMIIQYENAVEAGKAKERWTKSLAASVAAANALQAALSNDGERARVADAMARLEKFKSSFLPVAQKLESMGFDSARVAAAVVDQALPDYDAAQAAIDGLSSELGVRAANSSQQLRQGSDIVVLVLGAALAVALLVITPLTLVNMQSICRPLRDARQLADAIAQGDLTASAVDTRGKDETAQLLRALCTMQSSLGQMVSQVRRSTDNISTASTEIATGNQDLSARTEQTASNLQQAASSMEQLTGTVKQSADSARQADQLAASAAQVAARGGEVVSQVVVTMDDINTSSKKIADIIGVIDGIAFQTNILALNAAVEAARAGEQGRGFAVVAGEVRSLAQRSAEAAKEIKALIGASVDKVESGSKLVADAGRTMQEIVGSVQRVTDIIGEITAASTEQSDGIGQVNVAVTQLDQMTQQNAALVEQSAAAAESLKQQAQSLAKAVGSFKLDDALRGAGVASADARAVPPAGATKAAVGSPRPPTPKAAKPAMPPKPASRAAAPSARHAPVPSNGRPTVTKTVVAKRGVVNQPSSTPSTSTSTSPMPPARTPDATVASASLRDDDWETF